jgi:hypothetical protein
MLRYWRPAGELAGNGLGEHNASYAGCDAPQEEQEHLRLAIRNGSVNFYRSGQSVAKVVVSSKGKIQARIHNKYVCDDSSAQGYVTLTSAGFKEPGTGRLVRYRGVAHLDKWIANAIRHSGTEKRFIDQVVAHNPNVIDLEMGLPAYSKVREERRAPRMDLVVLESAGDSWKIVFWEAKLTRDSRVRCSGPAIPELKPEVLKQLGDYKKWLWHDNNCELVAAEYQNACRLLVAFHVIAKRFNPVIEELGAGVRAVAIDGAPPPLVDDKPRLLIDDLQADASFKENGHLDKLRNTGLHVKVVRSQAQMGLETPS